MFLFLYQMALQSLKIKFTILLLICFYFQAFSQLPACKDSFPTSSLPNNSFEQYPGCSTENFGIEEGGLLASSDNYEIPGWQSVWRGSGVKYHNYNCRLNKTASIFDPTIFCHSFVKIPLPLPDSSGFIEIGESPSQTTGTDEIHSGKSYIGTCLQQPLYAGQPYTFSFYFGFGKFNNLSCGGHVPWNSPSPYGIAIYGRTDCPNYPIDNSSTTSGCLTDFPGWIMLGRVVLSGQNQWVQGVIEFTPTVNIYSIAVGADCTNYYSYTQDNELHYYMDKFVLAPKADFAFKTITAIAGNACSGHYVLKAPPYHNATYQWYKDQVLIPGATSETLTVPEKPEAAGNYVVNVGRPYNTCLNSLPFPVNFSQLNNFTLGKDTLLCSPASITLNANDPNVTSYLWQNGSTDDTQQVDTSGLYWVRLTDEYGCVKKDSINITVRGCETCRLFIPSAFTPNDDGLNDIFKATPQCKYIGLRNFDLRIYNRWGQLVFSTNDINRGWNGMYKNEKVDPGIFLYVVNYALLQNEPLQQRGTVTVIR